MSELESNRAALERRCSEAIEQLLARYGWQLLDRVAFVQRTVDHLVAGIASDPRRAAIYTYSQALHTACSGAEGAPRQNIGYTELFRYLYDCARRRYPDVSDDATQRALERTFVAFERCRQPGAFLAFALQHLMDAARAVRRQEQPLQSLAAPIGESGDTLGELLPDQRQGDPSVNAIASDLRARFDQVVARFLERYPRAKQQFAALHMKYIEGLDDLTISKRLGKPVKSIYLLRHRALSKLREDEEWRALGGEFDLLPEESTDV